MAEKEEYDVDEILPFVGEFSRFQIIIEVLLMISIIPYTMPILIMYFAALNSPWRCAANSTMCTFPTNQTFDSSSSQYEARCSMKRSDWEFVQPKDFSIVTQYDLYCDTEIYTYLATSFFFIGWGIGAILLGHASDKYGRLKVLFPSLAMIMVVGFLSVFSSDVWLFLITRIIVGFFTPGAGVLLVVLANEFVGHRYRPTTGNLLSVAFTLGLVLVGAQAYFIRKWKTLFIVCTTPYIFVLAFAKFIPESVRWLNLNGKKEKAMEILRKIAKFNMKEIPSNVTLKGQSKEVASGSYIDLFKTWSIAKETIVQFYAWTVIGLVYYGVALAANDLGGALYRDYILASLVDFPAAVLTIPLLNSLGRKKVTLGGTAIASVACIAVAFIPTDKGHELVAFRVFIGMVGKFGVSVAFSGIYTWSVELYPTTVRSQGMGLMQLASRIGAASAPWVAKGLKRVHKFAPFLVMGISSSIAGVCMLILRETRGRKTAEVIENKGAIEKANADDNQADPNSKITKVNMDYKSETDSTKM